MERLFFLRQTIIARFTVFLEFCAALPDWRLPVCSLELSSSWLLEWQRENTSNLSVGNSERSINKFIQRAAKRCKAECNLWSEPIWTPLNELFASRFIIICLFCTRCWWKQDERFKIIKHHLHLLATLWFSQLFLRRQFVQLAWALWWEFSLATFSSREMISMLHVQCFYRHKLRRIEKRFHEHQVKNSTFRLKHFPQSWIRVEVVQRIMDAAIKCCTTWSTSRCQRCDANWKVFLLTYFPTARKIEKNSPSFDNLAPAQSFKKMHSN